MEQTVKATQEKQKLQHLKRERGFDYSFKNGDTVLRCNMLQKTKKGHKMEDRSNGPYSTELDLKRNLQVAGKEWNTSSQGSMQFLYLLMFISYR